MKILVLSFYYFPDLCAGSFRNTPFVETLSKKVIKGDTIDVITTIPNRYSTFKQKAEQKEKKGNVTIYRIDLPKHTSGIQDQIRSFTSYYLKALHISKRKKYDKVYASSSRLFTAYLGYKIASKQKIPLFLDMRDIFIDTIADVFKSKLVLNLILPFLRSIENKTFNYASHINLVSGGFEEYFKKFKCKNYSFYTNGIDNVFLDFPDSKKINEIKVITYAGNIGEGQGLEKIIPASAKELEGTHQFRIIGDGGSKHKLIKELEKYNCTNVELLNPIGRKELLEYYYDADFLFLHLNDYNAFKKVLPSKIFEYASTDKPIIAGVGGFSNKFIKENVSNCILFPPCNKTEFVNKINAYNFKFEKRQHFIEEFKRENIMNSLVEDFIKL